MTLKKILQTYMYKEIENIEIGYIKEFAKLNKEVIEFSYKTNILTDELLESALAKAIRNQAKKDYKYLISSTLDKTYSTHKYSPRCLAYSIKNKQLNEEEIYLLIKKEKIDFEEFIKKQKTEELINDLKNTLLR
jgi:hypothetical protein